MEKKGRTPSKRSVAWSGLSELARKAFTTCSLVKSSPTLIIWSTLACETPKFDDKPGPLVKAGPGPVGILGCGGAGAGTGGRGALMGKTAWGAVRGVLTALVLAGPAGPPLSCDGIDVNPVEPMTLR